MHYPTIGIAEVGMLDHKRHVMCLKSPSNSSVEISDFMILSRLTDEISGFLADFSAGDILDESAVFYVGKICDFGDMEYSVSLAKMLGCSSVEQYVVGYVFDEGLAGYIGVKSGKKIYNISPVACIYSNGKIIRPLEFTDTKTCYLAWQMLKESINSIF